MKLLTSGLESCSPVLVPSILARSADRVKGLVSPDPLGMVMILGVLWGRVRGGLTYDQGRGKFYRGVS